MSDIPLFINPWAICNVNCRSLVAPYEHDNYVRIFANRKKALISLSVADSKQWPPLPRILGFDFQQVIHVMSEKRDVIVGTKT